MSKPAIVPLTPLLQKFAANAVLEGRAPISAPGNAVLYQYNLAEESRKDILRDICLKACTREPKQHTFSNK